MGTQINILLAAFAVNVPTDRPEYTGQITIRHRSIACRSDQGLHCLSFNHHCFKHKVVEGKGKLMIFYIISP